MPELHKNQVSWDAPEPAKVTLTKPDYTPLVKSLGTLSNAADELADYTQGVLDVEAKEKTAQSVNDALTKLSRHEPSDNNYGPAMKEFNTSIQSTLDSFGDSTKARFLRDNPTFFDEARLRADEIIFEKQQKFTNEKVDEMIPLLASNVTEGITPYEDARAQLDNMVAQLPNYVANRKQRDFDTMVQETNLNNLIYAGRYSDAIAFLENPKDSDMITPSVRSEKKAQIQKLMDQEAEARMKLKQQAEKDATDNIEKGLTSTLLYALDKKDNTYVQLLKLLDDPEKEIPLSDEEGNVIAHITAKNIPVSARRKAMKSARDYEADSQAYYDNAARAREKADVLEKQFMEAQGKRMSGEVFNKIYDFTQSPDFYYLKSTERDKLNHIIFTEVFRKNELVVPYEAFRDQDDMLYGVIRSQEGASPAKAIRLITTGNKDIDDIYYGNSLTPIEQSKQLRSEVRQRWFRQLTTELRDDYKARTDQEVLYGSELEYLMDVYAAFLSYTPDERETYGIGNATDEQIGLTYNRLLGKMEVNNETNRIIGQNMDQKTADSIRDGIFNDFTLTLANGRKHDLTDEQKKNQKKLLDDLASGSYGLGGAWFSNTPTERSVVENNKVYGKALTNAQNKDIKKYQEGK